MEFNLDIVKQIADSSIGFSLKNLNDFDLGIVEGYLAAKQGKGLEDVIVLSNNDTYIEGVKKGFRIYNKVEFMSSLKDSISSYKKNRTRQSFLSVLKSLNSRIKDNDYSLYKSEDGNLSVGQVYSKDRLEEVQEILNENPELKIVQTNEDGSVVLGSSDGSISDSALSYLAKSKGLYYVRGRLFDSEANLISDSEEFITRALIEPNLPTQGFNSSDIVWQLKSLISEEYIAWYHYFSVYHFLCGNERSNVADLFKKNADDELNDHAVKLLKRYSELVKDEAPLLYPCEWFDYSLDSIYRVADMSLNSQLSLNIELEKEAIEHYKEVIELAGRNEDFTTQDILKQILADEEEHLSELSDLKSDINN